MQSLSAVEHFRKIGFNAWLLLLSNALILVSLSFWIFAYYPQLGHDYSYWVPQLFELHIAWRDFGKVLYDFSPVRCLGLPAFSHPNTLQLSLFHLAGLLTSEVWAIQLVFLFIILFSFFGTFLLCRHLQLEKPVSILLALGWVLQGWVATRVLVGHVPFIHLALAPWIFYVIISRRNYGALVAAAFWIAHMLYSAAFYTTVIMLVSLVLGLVALRSLQPDKRAWDWKSVIFNLSFMLIASILISLPKIIGALDFLALFPREQFLQKVGAGGSFIYTMANLFYPFPYNISRVTGWQYGPWEAYQYLLPLLFPALLLVLIRQRATVNWKPILLVFGGLVFISVVLTSGALGNVFSALPILKSLHVNPRWNGVILLPMFLLAIMLVRQTGFLSAPGRSNRLGLLFFFLAFSVVPLLYVAPAASWGFYPDGAGIDRGTNRVGFCYEPIFGYRLEHFPGGNASIDWLKESPRNPQCLLKSGQCIPGVAITDSQIREDLHNFNLRQPNAFVRVTRPFSLFLYILALIGTIGVFARMAVETAKQCSREKSG